MTKQIDESDLDSSYQVGVSAGLNMAAVKLDAAAQSAFSLGQDDQARELRSWSQRFREMSEAEHPSKKEASLQ